MKYFPAPPGDRPQSISMKQEKEGEKALSIVIKPPRRTKEMLCFLHNSVSKQMHEKPQMSHPLDASSPFVWQLRRLRARVLCTIQERCAQPGRAAAGAEHTCMGNVPLGVALHCPHGCAQPATQIRFSWISPSFFCQNKYKGENTQRNLEVFV